MAETGIGAAVRRIEDYRFLTGQGTDTDDINRPSQTDAYSGRSTVADASIKTIRTNRAASRAA